MEEYACKSGTWKEFVKCITFKNGIRLSRPLCYLRVTDSTKPAVSENVREASGGYCFYSIRQCFNTTVFSEVPSVYFLHGFTYVNHYLCKWENNLDQVKETLICEAATISTHLS